VGIRRNSNEDGAVTASLADSEFSGSTSRPGSVSAVKVSWPICRDLPGDCGTANLRSDNVRVDARVVRSVMVKAGLLYVAVSSQTFPVCQKRFKERGQLHLAETFQVKGALFLRKAGFET
jgi:hypothetical protein